MNVSLEQRLERVRHSLYQNSALTDSLNDAQAEKLLNWAYKVAEQIVRRTDGVLDDEADALIEEGMKIVSRFMRRIGRLIDKLGDMDADELLELLGKLFDSAKDLENTVGLRVRVGLKVQEEVRAILKMDPSEGLERVLAWFGFDGE